MVFCSSRFLVFNQFSGKIFVDVKLANPKNGWVKLVFLRIKWFLCWAQMLSVLSNAAITGCQPMSGSLLWRSVCAESTPENSVAVPNPFLNLRILSIVGLAGILSTIPFREIGGWRHRRQEGIGRVAVLSDKHKETALIFHHSTVCTMAVPPSLLSS